jgi:hypothetical protein
MEGTQRKLPSLAEIHEENLEIAFKNEQLNLLLNSQPKPEWIKQHPFITNYKYLPIDKVEYLLRRIFKFYRIEILREGVSFNGVYVVVRVHFLNPVTNEWSFHDGIGAQQLQTKAGTSAADLININNGAVAMAFPIAKTVAIKDACDHFGNLFGANINRKDAIEHNPDNSVLKTKGEIRDERIITLIKAQTSVENLESIAQDVPENLNDVYYAKMEELKNGK